MDAAAKPMDGLTASPATGPTPPTLRKPAFAVAVAVAVALIVAGAGRSPAEQPYTCRRDCLPCPRSAGCAAAGGLQRRCRLDRAAALAVALRTGLRHGAACGARTPWPAGRCGRLCCIASSNARHWALNWPCITCRSTSARASALKARRGRHDVQRSPPNCATAKHWHWRSTRTIRPRPSCCGPCADPASMALPRCPHTAALANSSMAASLLAVPRSALLDYARQHALRWIEDPSNGHDHADRNFLRLQVLPLLRQRWPHAAAALAGSAMHCGQTRALLDEEDAELIAHLEVAPRVLSLQLLRQVSLGVPRACCAPG